MSQLADLVTERFVNFMTGVIKNHDGDPTNDTQPTLEEAKLNNFFANLKKEANTIPYYKAILTDLAKLHSAYTEMQQSRMQLPTKAANNPVSKTRIWLHKIQSGIKKPQQKQQQKQLEETRFDAIASYSSSYSSSYFRDNKATFQSLLKTSFFSPYTSVVDFGVNAAALFAFSALSSIAPPLLLIASGAAAFKGIKMDEKRPKEEEISYKAAGMLLGLALVSVVIFPVLILTTTITLATRALATIANELNKYSEGQQPPNQTKP